MALEKLTGMEGEDSDEEQILWLESEGELREVQESKEKGKQKEERVDGAEEGEENRGQEEKNRMEEENRIEGVEEDGSFSPVTSSVRTGNL